MSENRRKYVRISTTRHLDINSLNGTMICHGHTLNISEGGCCVLCEKEFQKGECYTLVFKHSEDELLTVSSIIATVVYQCPDTGIFRTGFMFNNKEDFLAIENF